MSSRFLEVPIRSRKFFYTVEVTEELCSVKTEFQQIDIVACEAFGRMLLLDGHIQLTELDEHAYHESLVHIPLLSTQNPKAALVIGGGDGGVLRELCKHPTLERIDMAEIDQGVIDACRKHLPSVSGGAFDDPRVHVHVTDAFQFVKDTPTKYDLIVADSTDTYEDEEGELSASLFTRAFYEDCRRILSPGGIMITQADNLVFCPYSTEGAKNAFMEVFQNVGIYQAIVPSFGGFSGFCWGSDGEGVRQEWTPNSLNLCYLDEATFKMAFANLGFAL
jgi:spermidine synthase